MSTPRHTMVAIVLIVMVVLWAMQMAMFRFGGALFGEDHRQFKAAYILVGVLTFEILILPICWAASRARKTTFVRLVGISHGLGVAAALVVGLLWPT